jgi:hypothetical protein
VDDKPAAFSLAGDELADAVEIVPTKSSRA